MLSILGPLPRILDTRILNVKKVLLTIGLQYETAGRGSLALYTSVCPPRPPYLSDNSDFLRQIIFALVFEFTMFHTTPPPLSIIGMLMILSSAIYTTVISPLSPLTYLVLTSLHS